MVKACSNLIAALALLFVAVWAPGAQAQGADTAWIQIESKPTLAQAQTAARAWARKLPDVHGFRAGKWYVLALGPYGAAEARSRLRALRALGQIPSDAFVSDGKSYRRQWWPAGAEGEAQPAPSPQAPRAIEAAPETSAAQTELPDETPAQARANERKLDREARKALQVALAWEGFYNSGIDGAFGPGTRRAMAAWQEANGYAPTGVLTTRQRARLLGAYNAMRKSLGLANIVDEAAGIEITIPTAMVEFDRYEAPFAHYRNIDGSGVRLELISETGDQDTLFGLYDILQSLRIVPLEGPRERRKASFTIEGANDEIVTHAQARLTDGTIKGFILVWPRGDEKRRKLVLDAMRASFKPIRGAVLADNAGLDEASARIDLLSGLEIRTPTRNRAGFFVSETGAVLTTRAAAEGCARITLDELTEAQLSATDEALGVALLTPAEPLAPRQVAAFAPAPPRIGAEIAVAGYAFGGKLTAPTLTFGTLAEPQGLRGEPEVARVELAAEDGDAGGPVFGPTGAVMGLLAEQLRPSGQLLPPEVRYVVKSDRLAEFLRRSGAAPATAAPEAPAMDPVDLAQRARDMTVLVSCWN